MEKVSSAEINQATVRAVRHFVTLSYYARSAEIMKPHGMAQVCVCSGFVMKARGIWFLVTAGHVLDGIDHERSEGIKLGSFRLWDGWAPEARDRPYLPFGFDGAAKLRLNRDGLDYGLIELRPYYVKSLEANGIVPVGEESYEKSWPADFHGYAMIGVPGRTVALDRHGECAVKFTQSVCAIHLAELKEPPQELVKPFHRFYARLLIPEHSPEWEEMGADIRGMSGGPVIGVRRDGNKLQYWIVAVQSGWLESRRIIAACYFQQFARIVGDLMA